MEFPINGSQLCLPEFQPIIFSYTAESHSYALGAQPPPVSGNNRPAPFNSHTNLETEFGFTDAHKFHSGQFRSTTHKRWAYWEQVLIDFAISP